MPGIRCLTAAVPCVYFSHRCATRRGYRGAKGLSSQSLCKQEHNAAEVNMPAITKSSTSVHYNG